MKLKIALREIKIDAVLEIMGGAGVKLWSNGV
jgi:hypothetical protein